MRAKEQKSKRAKPMRACRIKREVEFPDGGGRGETRSKGNQRVEPQQFRGSNKLFMAAPWPLSVPCASCRVAEYVRGISCQIFNNKLFLSTALLSGNINQFYEPL